MCQKRCPNGKFLLVIPAIRDQLSIELYDAVIHAGTFEASGVPIPDVSDKNAGLIKHLVNRRGLYQDPEVAKNG